ncbi:ATP phosphoribosyltransferase [Natranaerofaba carboxydovora]|uniref:ATP phosphoribosyltransferase n=1 Tax=Natranaerofaba carboxydovora TaxID=2742683 RepID=UPI001F1294EA|nr:ATP phosphoribosyltransferase [Natranaerofaba carboxydovora]UMZ73229.1 ATP phosphoribosyltransferase [Natranaerofaba carboxydovora]
MRNNDSFTIALTKGRILEPTMEILKKVDFNLEEMEDPGRKLILKDKVNNTDFILAKPDDVPIYVENGAADLGIVGKDILIESDSQFYELLDLKIGYCRMVLAKEKDITPKGITVASKFPKITEKYFKEKGQNVNIIKLHGSIELAPLLNLSDQIVDLVSTGSTLKENNLEEVETITEITTRLIANQGSYQIKRDRINNLLKQLKKVI